MATPQQTAALSNQSLVFEVFSEHEKLTIPEITGRVNEKLKSTEALPISEQTVRRATKALSKSGLLREFGRQNNATLYGKLSASYSDTDQKLINFGGTLLDVEDFLRLITSPDEKPLQVKFNVISDKREHDIRRRLAFVIMSAGELGFNDRLAQVMKELRNLQAEFVFTAELLQSFLDSPVWYQQYREQIGYAMRKLQERDPDLFQLTAEYVKGG